MSEESLRQYVSTGLLPSMGIAGRPFTAISPGSSGTRSRLLLVRIEGMPPLLLRAFARRRQAVKNAEALRHLDALGLQAPRLVAHDLKAPVAGLWPGPETSFITVETWVEGNAHADLHDPVSAAEAALGVARLLSRWHAVTRLRWGRPSGGRFRSFLSYTLLGVRRMIGSLQSRGWLDPESARALPSRFDAWNETIGSIESYSLVHNDANRRNFVVTAAGDVVPVDLHRVAYEPFPEEMVNALYHFCRKDPPLRERFLETYFENAQPAARQLFVATRPFFEPLNYLKKMHRRAGMIPPASSGPDAKMDSWRKAVLAIAAPG